MILDGVGYHFDMWIFGRGVVSGRVGTPDPNSKTGRFVGLTLAISDFAKGKISEQQMSDAVKRFESTFEKPREPKKVS